MILLESKHFNISTENQKEEDEQKKNVLWNVC